MRFVLALTLFYLRFCMPASAQGIGTANIIVFGISILRSISKTSIAFVFFSFIFFGANVQAQDQVTFRQLSVKDGLSQNSAISIIQDSIGYLWIATQDGLNKYDGRKFTRYPFQFVDITRPDYSHLGKLYLDRQHQLWIIPTDNVLYKYDPESDVFKPQFNIDDAYTLFQDSNENYWISTHKKEVFFVDGKSMQISKIPFDRALQGIINDIAEIHPDTILLLGKNEFVKIAVDTKNSVVIQPKGPSGKALQSNFSAMTSGKSEELYFGTTTIRKS